MTSRSGGAKTFLGLGLGRLPFLRLRPITRIEQNAYIRPLAIVHPLVRAAQARFLADAERSGAPVAVLDVPLLFETGGDRRVDAVVVVSAPADVQRARTLDRAGMTAEKFEALLQKQMPDDEKRRRADFVVDTSQSLDSARAQVRAILASVRAIRTRRDTDADA